MQAARAANDALRFLLELAALTGLAIWGWGTGPTGVNVVLAIAVGVLAASHLVATFPLGQRRPWVDAKP